MAPLIELRHLRYFLAVVKPLTYSSSRDSLHLSAHSQQIKQLEAELGTTLFDRIGKRDPDRSGRDCGLMRSEC